MTKYSVSTRALRTIASVGALVALGFIAPSAAGAASNIGVTPDVISCSPPAGTITSETATSNTEAWMPTNLESSFINGPGTINYTISASSGVTSTVSAGVTVDAGFLFASASSNFGVSLAGSASTTTSWTYNESVPSGYTAAVQQYHQASELGIHEVQEILTSPTSCGTQTINSPSGNYFPYSSTASNTYCYAITVYNTSSLGPQVGSGCSDTL